MIHRCFIAAAKTFAVVSLGTVWNMGMTILVPVVDIRSAVIVVVFARALNAVVKTLTLDIAKLLRRSVPGAVLSVSLNR